MTVKQAASKLGVSASLIYAQCQAGSPIHATAGPGNSAAFASRKRRLRPISKHRNNRLFSCGPRSQGSQNESGNISISVSTVLRSNQLSFATPRGESQMPVLPAHGLDPDSASDRHSGSIPDQCGGVAVGMPECRSPAGEPPLCHQARTERTRPHRVGPSTTAVGRGNQQATRCEDAAGALPERYDRQRLSWRGKGICPVRTTHRGAFHRAPGTSGSFCGRRHHGNGHGGVMATTEHMTSQPRS